MSTSISLSRASPLELAHNPGRLGCILAEMRAMVRIIFTILSHFGARALFVCLWLECRAVAVQWLLVARLMHVLASPVEPADGLGRFGCVRAEMGAMVYAMFVFRSFSGTRASEVRVCCLQSHVALRMRGTDTGRTSVQCGPMK
jgi:hypothetical protein